MPPTPTLVAIRAPRTSWPRSSILSSVHGKRGSPDRSRSGTTLTALNTCSFGNQVRKFVGRLFPADPCAEDCLQKVSTLMARFSLALFELVKVWRWRAMAIGANHDLILVLLLVLEDGLFRCSLAADQAGCTRGRSST